MVNIADLWQPILLSSVIVFFASWIVNTLLPWHRNDYRGVPNEDATLAALRQLNIPPGDYYVPRAGSMAAMREAGFLAKLKQGPLVLLRLQPGRTPAMGAQLVQWFLYLLVVGITVAYVASRTVAAGSDYAVVYRVAGCVAFVAYSYAQPMESIWFWRKWSTTLLFMFDGLIYALLTGGTFGWLWPHAATPL